MREQNKAVFKKRVFDYLAIACIFFIALILYSYKADSITPGIQLDELTIAKAGEHILLQHEYTPFISINYGHPTPLLYFEGISIHLFGVSLFAIRFLAYFLELKAK